jgi:integrase/recombinase XerD
MTPLAPHLTAFLRERLPRERQASPHTCDSYAYAFQLLLCFASTRLRTPPSSLMLEQLDVPLVLNFLDDLETTRGNGARTRNARLAAIRSFARFIEFRVPSCIQQTHSLLAIPSKKTDEKLVGYLTRTEMCVTVRCCTLPSPPDFVSPNWSDCESTTSCFSLSRLSAF